MAFVKTAVIALSSSLATTAIILSTSAVADENEIEKNGPVEDLQIIASAPVVVQLPRGYEGSTAQEACTDLGFDEFVGEHIAKKGGGGTYRLVSCKMNHSK